MRTSLRLARGTGAFRSAAAIRLLAAMERHTPDRVIRMQLQILLFATARGFGVKEKRILHLPARQALEAYAEFTVSCMNGLAAREKSDPGSRRRQLPALYREAYRTGSLLRRVTGFRHSRDRQRLIFWLYRNLQIAMEGKIPGQIRVSRCYFSRLYTPEQCAVMSLVDAGVMAGICGGGKLQFTERITEGCERCTACFRESTKERIKR